MWLICGLFNVTKLGGRHAFSAIPLLEALYLIQNARRNSLTWPQLIDAYTTSNMVNAAVSTQRSAPLFDRDYERCL
jgi:hypothetical protein